MARKKAAQAEETATTPEEIHVEALALAKANEKAIKKLTEKYDTAFKQIVNQYELLKERNRLR